MKFRESFETNGISETKLYGFYEIIQLRKFLHNWISNNFMKQGVNLDLPKRLSSYHDWSALNKIPHDKLFTAPQRFTNPPKLISDILLNSRVKQVFPALNLRNPRIIDEGMGWLGYRIIRPGMNDGYPISQKNWGASKGAYSFWVPLFTFGSKYSLHYVAGSHKKNYNNFLPNEKKFTKDEFRLDPMEKVKIQSQFVFPGHALFFAPTTLHTEDVQFGNKTRLNLEFRFLVDSD
jgi:hypothetical protein